MNYLDENIIVSLTGLTVPASGTYTYNVKMGNTIVFYGNLYLSAGATATSIDITEIVANQKWNPTTIITGAAEQNSSIKIDTAFTVAVEIGDNTYTEDIDVALIYRYPHRMTKLESTLALLEEDEPELPLIQGYSETGMALTPRVPFIPTANYPLAFVHHKGPTSTANLYTIKTGGAVAGKTLTESLQSGDSVIKKTLFRMFVGITPDETQETATIDLYSGTTKLYTIADVDLCPADYYLLWQDRYGSFQSQPFRANHTFSESITRDEVKNIKLQRRINTVSAQPKWMINSGWIDFSLIPFYESILVSPVLLLYDAKEDKSYPVIVTNSDYSEKTYRNNQRQLFNMELDLELSKKQTIIY